MTPVPWATNIHPKSPQARKSFHRSLEFTKRLQGAVGLAFLCAGLGLLVLWVITTSYLLIAAWILLAAGAGLVVAAVFRGLPDLDKWEDYCGVDNDGLPSDTQKKEGSIDHLVKFRPKKSP